MIKKAFLNNVYLQRIHDEYILDMYTKKVCKQQNIFVKPIKQYTESFTKKNGKSYLTIEKWKRTHINVCIISVWQSVIKTFKKLLYRKIFECAVDRALIKYECGMLHFRGGGQTLKHSKTVNHSKTIKRSKTYKSLYSAAAQLLTETWAQPTFCKIRIDLNIRCYRHKISET